MKLHAEINQPERIKTQRQPLIKEYMVGLGTKATKSGCEDSCKEIQKGNKSKKRRTRNLNYVNPDSEESDNESAEIRFPPSPKLILSKYIDIRKGRENGGVIYWEWKAG